jgi:hypothetical protein
MVRLAVRNLLLEFVYTTCKVCVQILSLVGYQRKACPFGRCRWAAVTVMLIVDAEVVEVLPL